MKDLLDKLSSYNVFNCLLPGIVFVFLSPILTPYSYLQKDPIIGVFLYYFIGLIINRFGSLVIEPLAKKVCLVKYSDHKEFVLATKKDNKIELLSEINNMYRTICSMFVLLILLKLYSLIELLLPFLKRIDSWVLVIFILLMFALSYRKQTEYINKRIEANR